MPNTSQGQWSTHLFYGYNYNNDLFFNDESIGNSHISRKVSSLLFQIDYALSDQFGVSLSIPYLWQKEIVDLSVNNTEYVNKGIGDIGVWLTYSKKFNSLNLNSALSIKTPTGSTDKEGENNLAFPISMQTGTGSYDFAFIVQSSWYLGKKKKFSLENQTALRLNSKGKNFKAHPNYKFGNQYLIYAGMGYHILLFNLVTDMFLGTSYQYRSQDEFDGEFENTNTGGHWINSSVGMNVFLTPEFFFSINASAPLYRNLNGLQLSTTSQLSASINMVL
ncbi:hypothetical protein [Reichenbachiella sp.]|uniref:hypothetical protein n=1 Tax=Reichenbachiella sp. TaxID=2184521 RepID=UPI003BB0EB15